MTGDQSEATGLEAHLDALYRAPLAEFVEQRDALSKRLKVAGAADEARWVKALRKPSAVAWAINRLHLERCGLAPLEKASEELRRALRDPRSAEERRRAIDGRRRALESVTAAVVALLEEAGTTVAPALLRRIERTLLAIAAGAGGADAPVAGRLDQELEPPGFEAILDFPSPSATARDGGAPASAAPSKKAAPGRAAADVKSGPLPKSAAAAKAAPAKAAPANREAPATRAAPTTRASKAATTPQRGAPPASAARSSAEREYVPSRDRRREAALAAAQHAVDDSEGELERATAKAEAARARVDDAEKTLEKAKREVEAARRELVATRTRLSDRRRELDRVRRSGPAV